jgi:hypothetical protein
MANRGGKHHREVDLEPLDDFGDFDDELDVKELSKDVYDDDWGDYDAKRDRADARRKIERRREMKRLYSELNDWEEFGLSDDWR